MPKKIVITGGSGFLGKTLAKRFPKKNLVIADVREPQSDFKKNWVYTDVTDSYSIYEACKGASHIYHLASNPFVPIGEKNPLYDVRLNIHGTINTINAAIQNKARMIFTSTMMVGKEESNYQISKWTCEQYIKYYVHKKGLNCVAVRLENLYGPNQRIGWVIPDFISKLRQNPNLLAIRGTGYAVRDFLYVDDAVGAIMDVIEKGAAAEIYPVSSGRKVTILQLAEIIAKVMKIKPELKPARPREEWKKIDFTPADCSKTHALGWRQKWTLEKGLKECIKAWDIANI